MLLFSFPIEVEGIFDFFFSGSLVDFDFTDTGEESEVDGACHIFLVVMHEFNEFGIIVAGEMECAVVLFYEVSRILSVGNPALVALRYNSLTSP